MARRRTGSLPMKRPCASPSSSQSFPAWTRPWRPLGAPGEVSQVSARHVDLLPTVLDAVGQPIPADLPGRTLLPAAERRGGRGRTDASPCRPSYCEAMASRLNRGWAPLQGVLADHQKYIDLPITELY